MERKQQKKMARQIELTRGYFTLVDDEDYDFLNQWNWHAGITGKGYVYAVRKQKNTEYTDVSKRKTVQMHRVIMDCPDDMEVDHINGDKLDNRKQNLRIVTPYQNTLNKRNNKRNTSGYKGVNWSKQLKKWRARIVINKQEIFLGLFDDPAEAAKAYEDAAIKYHGEFASTYRKGN